MRLKIDRLQRENKPALAYVHIPAKQAKSHLPTVVFLGGYRSDMEGTKALYLEKQAKKKGYGFLRFDYSGHGQSEGNFNDFTIGDWRDDALDILHHINAPSYILIGSSMGGWISLLILKEFQTRTQGVMSQPVGSWLGLFALRELQGRIAGMIGIAAAPDFTEEIYNRLTDEQRAILHKEGHVSVPNDYSDEPYYYSLSFYEEAKNHLLLHEQQTAPCPVTLIQGKRDADVPWQTAEAIKNAYDSPGFEIDYVDDGDHRLSTPEDLKRIQSHLDSLLAV